MQRRFSAEPSTKPLRPLRYIMYDDYKAWYAKMTRIYMWMVGGGVILGTSVLVALYTYGAPPARKSMLSAFVVGFVPSKWTNNDNASIVPRPELDARLLALVRPTAVTSTYAVIVGEHGTGKSTAVRKAARTRGTTQDGVNGVVYIEVAESRKFSVDLLSCLDAAVPTIDWLGGVRRRVEATTKDEVGVDLTKEPLSTWLTVTGPLEAAAEEFRQAYKRPMTLVIDGVQKFVADDPLFLNKLQDFAKAAATTGNLQVVFVSSDMSALEHMRRRSSWSRAAPALYIGDITDDEAVDFLVKERRLDRARSVVLVRDITGGRFSLLVSEADTTVDVATVRHTKYTQTSAALIRVGLEPSHAFFKQLVSSKEGISTVDALRLLTEAKITELLSANVISARANETYVAHSRYVESFLKSQLA